MAKSLYIVYESLPISHTTGLVSSIYLETLASDEDIIINYDNMDGIIFRETKCFIFKTNISWRKAAKILSEESGIQKCLQWVEMQKILYSIFKSRYGKLMKLLDFYLKEKQRVSLTRLDVTARSNIYYH